MSYWVKKDFFVISKYFNSLENKTRILSRIIAFIILLISLFIAKCYYFRITFVNLNLSRDHTWYRGSYTSRTWEELISNLPNIFYDSFLYAAGIFLFIHFLDYFSKDKFPPLICDTCFKQKDFDNDLKCECGGKYVREDEYECFESEEEYKLVRPYAKLKNDKTKSGINS